MPQAGSGSAGDVIIRTQEEETILHLWVCHPNEAILRSLVAAGAELEALDDMGVTPLGSLAESWAHEERKKREPQGLSAGEGLKLMGLDPILAAELDALPAHEPDFQRAYDLLIEVGCDPENLGPGCAAERID